MSMKKEPQQRRALKLARDRSGPPAALSAVALACLLGSALPALAQNAASAAQQDLDPWKVELFYENDTHYRGKDATGKSVGLSKFRNTLQMDADKKLSDGWAFHGIFRGTWDGVYRMNKDEFGKSAGSKSAADVQIQNTAGPAALGVGLLGPNAAGNPLSVHYGSTVPFGSGVGYTIVDVIEGQAGLPNLGGPGGGPGFNKFIDPNYANTALPPASYGPGTGLRVLGDRWHSTTTGGVAFAVPVRPCDYDKRGCTDFGGYGDKNLSELEAPEFNNRLDFIREAYVKKTFGLADGSDLFVKLGKQQVVWGRTDLFRVLDVINPVDYSRNNIYDELQDIRIPLWIAQAEWRMGGSESMQDRNLSVVWNFDQFRANNLGQCGTPNVILDAGCAFRGLKNLWDNGTTVSNFAGFVPPGTPAVLPNAGGVHFATNFGPNQIGLRNVHLPEWKLKNQALGLKFEGVSKDGLAFSLNALSYMSQLPSLRGIDPLGANGPTNPFVPGQGNTFVQGLPPFAATPNTSHLIAFDMHFPRINMLGGSMDFQVEKLNAAMRVEGAFTSGEEFANTLKPQLYSKNKVFRSVIGFDRPTFVPFINPNRTTLFSAQLFYQHIFDHQEEQRAGGMVGMPDWKDNVIGTLLIKAFLVNDRLSPQLIMARDFKAHAWVASPQVEWSMTDALKLVVGGNFKGKTDDSNTRWSWDDCRSCNPYAPFTSYGDPSPGSYGMGGLEPLGRFRAGPIGSAWKENEVYFSMRYKF